MREQWYRAGHARGQHSVAEPHATPETAEEVSTHAAKETWDGSRGGDAGACVAASTIAAVDVSRMLRRPDKVDAANRLIRRFRLPPRQGLSVASDTAGQAAEPAQCCSWSGQ